MSTKDEEILLKIDITHQQLSEALGNSRQAVSQGLGNKNVNYLNYERLSKLYAYLKLKDENKALILNEIIKNKFPNKFSLEEKSPLKHNFEDLWIFSQAPIELYDQEFFEEMKNHYNNPKETIIYFVPSDSNMTRNNLCKLIFQSLDLRSLLDSNNNKNIARIFVIESNAISLMPHYVIFNPTRGKGKKGVILSVDKESFEGFFLPDTVIETVRVMGVGIDPINYLSTDLEESNEGINYNNIIFRVVFSSLWIWDYYNSEITDQLEDKINRCEIIREVLKSKKKNINK